MSTVTESDIKELKDLILEFTDRTIFVAIVGALFAGLVKLFFPGFPGNP